MRVGVRQLDWLRRVADYELPPHPTAPQEFVPRLFSRCQVEAFAAGNLSAEAAVAFAQALESQLRERCVGNAGLLGLPCLPCLLCACQPSLSAKQPASFWSAADTRLLTASTPPADPQVQGAAALCLPADRAAGGALAARRPCAAHPAGAQPLKRQLGGGGGVPGGWVCCVLPRTV